jgi:hypothetical protein
VCTLYDSDGNILSRVEITKANEKPVIFSDDCKEFLSIADVAINKIFILLPELGQALKRENETNQDFNVRKERYGFNFECVKGLAEAINKSRSGLIEVTSSRMPA